MKTSRQLLLAIFFVAQVGAARAVATITYGPFGKVAVYFPAKKPTSVALFVSGNAGWESGVISMAKNIAGQGALVLGIDALSYKKSLAKSISGCLYPAADFEDLSMMIQKKYNFPEYLKPILIGYAYGATLIYGILAQAPANTFKGGIALEFCPEFESTKPLCKGAGLSMHAMSGSKAYYLDRTDALSAPFIVFNGGQDRKYSYQQTTDYFKDLPMAELVSMPNLGHGIDVNAKWIQGFKTAYQKILAAPSFSQRKEQQNKLLMAGKVVPLPGSLPLTLVPSSQTNDLPLVFFISGDGGWTSFDQSLSESISEKGLPVIGLDAQKYFWRRKTPEQSTADVSKAITHYMQQWNKTSFILMGFSFGASVVPFIATRLAPDLKSRIRKVVSLSPDENADFEIHISDMLNFGRNTGHFDVLSELIKIKELKPICIFGQDEHNGLEEKLLGKQIKSITLPGGHHYDNNYSGITKIIVESIKP